MKTYEGFLFFSCFAEDSFTPRLRLEPALSSPQAATVELTANFSKLIAAFRSLPIFKPQWPHLYTRSGFENKVRSFLIFPQEEQVFEEG